MGVPVIIGGGLAGMTAALAMAPRPVIVLGRKAGQDRCSSELAQGGLAVALGADDNTENHIQDTLRAGAGACDEAAVRSIVEAGPQAVARLLEWGVPFDTNEDGTLRLGLEGAHGHRRVAHAKGDSTGAQIMIALVALTRRTPSIRFIEDAQACEIEADGHGVSGVVFDHKGGRYRLPTRQVVLATGSACALWRTTSVPLESWGHGLYLAGQLDARMKDLEYVQFHPTAFAVGLDPLPLITEALRGEGAKLITPDGQRFVDELSPRDIVARAIFAQRAAGRDVYLDARGVANFASHFPTISAIARRAGLDPAHDPLPVRPSAHYHMGGVETDLAGQTSVGGLWACGEVACTGLHGANRLASNSLLEAAVMGLRVAAAMEEGVLGEPEACGYSAAQPCADSTVLRVRTIMDDKVGVLRDRKGLQSAIEQLDSLSGFCLQARIGARIARAALARGQSMGAHCRTDAAAFGKEEYAIRIA